MTMRLTALQQRVLRYALSDELSGGHYSHVEAEQRCMARLRKRGLLKFGRQRYGVMRFYLITDRGRAALGEKDQAR